MKALSSRGNTGSLKRWLCAIVLIGTALPIAAVAAPACLALTGGIGGTGAPAEHGGIGGTGAPAQDGGIGGTGAKESPARGGIGGTGQQADGGIGGTGIVGIITGFGSVCVNGLELEYDRATPINVNGVSAQSDLLALGQVIAIDASGGGTKLLANSITILNALEGPVTQVHADGGLLYVMKQPVRITAETHFAGITALSEATLGLPVRISGYRNATNEVVASRIEVARDMADVSVIGMVTSDRSDSLTVSGLPVRSTTPPAPMDTETLVRGVWDGERLNAKSIGRDPSLPFAGHVVRVVIEGLVLKRFGTRQLAINGFHITLSADTALDGGDISEALEGRRIRVTGRLGQGRHVTADHVEMMLITPMGKPMGIPGGMSGSVGGMSQSGMSMGNSGMIGSPRGMSPPSIPMGGGGGMHRGR